MLLIVNYTVEPTFDLLDCFQHFLCEGEELLEPDLGCASAVVWEEMF